MDAGGQTRQMGADQAQRPLLSALQGRGLPLQSIPQPPSLLQANETTTEAPCRAVRVPSQEYASGHSPSVSVREAAAHRSK